MITMCAVLLISILFISNVSSLKRCISCRRHNDNIYLSAENARNSASLSLIKKGKMKTLEKIYNDLSEKGKDHPINVFLDSGVRPYGIGNPKDFYNTTKSSSGTITVLPEFNKKAKTGFIIGLPPPEIMGGVLRDAGAKAIIVSVDSKSGGATIEEFERFTREQTRARIFMPGPIAIVWNDVVVDKIQISYAATLGAAGIVLQADLVDNLSELITYSRSLKVEPIVLSKDADEALFAIQAGSRCICLHMLEESKLLELKKQLPLKDANNQDILYSAKLRPESDFSTYSEIDISWVLRDNGFSSVWPSPEAVYATGMPDVYTSIIAMKAKASRVYLSPRQFLMDRKNEGATEFLGDIYY